MAAPAATVVFQVQPGLHRAQALISCHGPRISQLSIRSQATKFPLESNALRKPGLQATHLRLVCAEWRSVNELARSTMEMRKAQFSGTCARKVLGL